MNEQAELFKRAKDAGILNIEVSGNLTKEMFEFAIDSTIEAHSQIDFKEMKKLAEKNKAKYLQKWVTFLLAL